MKSKLIKEELVEAPPTNPFLIHNQEFNDQRTSSDWFNQYKKYLPDKSVFVVLKDSETIIGTQGFMPYFISYKDSIILTAKSENTLIKSEYRNLSTFKGFYEFGLKICDNKEIKIIWGMTELGKLWEKALKFQCYDNIFIRMVGLNGFKSNFQVISEKMLRNKKGFKKSLIKTGLIPLVLGFTLKNGIKRKLFFLKSNKLPKNIAIKNEIEDTSDFSKLYEKMKAENKELIFLNMDNTMFEWRVKNHWKTTYITKFVYKNNELIGYAIYTFNLTLREAHITDLTFIDNSIGKLLLNEIYRNAKRYKVTKFSFLGNQQNNFIKRTILLFKKAGFISRQGTTNFVLRNNSDIEIADISNWYITGLWSEGYNS